MTVEVQEITNNELNKTVQAKTFRECVSKEIPHQMKTHPEMDQKQAVAIAHSKCRKRFGIEKADILRMIESESLFDMKLLRMLETGKIFDIKLQQPLLEKIKHSLDNEDLIKYGVLLRKEGMTTAETAKYLPYKESWVKKHINPAYNKVIEKEKDELEESQDSLSDIHDMIGQFTILDLKKEQRRFTAYASAEQEDSQGDIVSIDGLLKNMPIFEQRGGPIMFSHTSRHVGKLLKWEKQNIDVNGQSIAAILVEIEVFPHYLGDDIAWACVLHAKEKDLPILSYGATPTSPPEKICDEVKCVRKYNDVQPYEISIVNVLKGIVGANPSAKIVSVGPILKPKKPIIHPMVGGKLAKAKETGTITNDLELLNFALETCDLCKAEYAKMVQNGKTDQEAQKLLLIELKKEMSAVIEEKAELELEKQEGEQSPAPPKPEGGLQQIMAMLQQILARLSQGEEKAVEEPATPIIQPENLTKSDIAKLVQAEVKKSLENLTPEDLIELAKQKNLEIISTPAPSSSSPVTERPELPPESLEKQDQEIELSDDDLINAMANYNGAQDIHDRIQQRNQ